MNTMPSKLVKSMYTPPQIAKLLKVSNEKVLTWIRNGELAAFNAATRPDSQRPRYRVTPEALQAFQARRAVTPYVGPSPVPTCPAMAQLEREGAELFFKWSGQ